MDLRRKSVSADDRVTATESVVREQLREGRLAVIQELARDLDGRRLVVLDPSQACLVELVDPGVWIRPGSPT
jgi:hypothetical protein